MKRINGLTPAERLVRYALEIGAFAFAPQGYRLMNGRTRPYFFNSGLFDTGEAIGEIASTYAETIEHGDIVDFDTLYSPPYQKTALAPAIAMALNDSFGRNVRWSAGHKADRTYTLVGAPITRDSRVVIISEVISDDRTEQVAVDFIKRQGGKAVGLIAVFDPQEHAENNNLSLAKSLENKFGFPVGAVATLADLISAIEETKCVSNDMLQIILDYRKKFGV
jgi:orotate phosphoribosyltransferase